MGDRDAERRLLALVPTVRDVELTRSVLDEARLPCTVCTTGAQLAAELSRGAAALMLPEEALADPTVADVVRSLSRQPPWSDLPLLLLTVHGADSNAVGRVVETVPNVTLLERPTRVSALVAAVRTAFRGRERQYQIRDHVAEREHAAELLRAADRRKDEFLATLAHELRNPLAPIRNALHLLRLDGDDPETVEDIRRILDRQVAHMVRLVDDLLELARITRDKIELRRERVDLEAVLRTAIEASRPLLDGARHRVRVRVPAARIPLDADPVRLAQVFANLLNNAAKYTDPGGRVRVSARRRGPWAVVAVRDSGIGIPPEMLPRVFEMFTQIDRSLGRAQGGLGIGLALVERLVRMHGGAVSAHSLGDGRGSRFVVRLPVAEVAQPGRPAAPGARPASPHATGGRSSDGPRVLVVDDNRDAADSLGMLLRTLGAHVRVVHDGRSAIEACSGGAPDVVFLDLGMPGMDGFEVARRLRAMHDGGGLVLVALTGWGQEEDRRRTRETGFDHHLTKPADVHAIEAILAAVPARTAA